MFEKEGIKYAIEETVGTECLYMPIEDFNFIDLSEPQQEKAQCFKDGAEFGYQKGIKAKINTTTISDCPIKDEWHYVKDGDLPKENKDCLVLFHNKYSDNIVKDISRYSVELKKWWFIHDLKDMEEEVIAWKEIVLPELPKE